MHSATRYHDISCGHRVVGHEGKCRFLHGHNYRIHFTIAADFGFGRTHELDSVGRVLDFSAIKSRLCEWLEANWDHRFLVWAEDEDLPALRDVDDTVVVLPFNPTAENLAYYLYDVIAPHQLKGTGARVTKVQIDETRKCSAAYEEGR